jgi:hypothetical protein
MTSSASYTTTRMVAWTITAKNPWVLSFHLQNLTIESAVSMPKVIKVDVHD